MTDTPTKLRTAREIRAMEKMQHQYIIRFQKVLESNKNIYVIMEYAAKGELFDFIISRGRLDEKLCAYLFMQMVLSVQYLHDNSVVHRDLKPENFLLNDFLEIKLSDFGFCNHIEKPGARTIKTPCGSPTYAAPEIFRGEAYDESVDIWSLGVNLFVMITGTSPWGDESTPYRKQKKRIQMASYHIPGYVSEDCRNLIAMMIQPEAKNRPSFASILNHPWMVQYASEQDKPTHPVLIQARKNRLSSSSSCQGSSPTTSSVPTPILAPTSTSTSTDTATSAGTGAGTASAATDVPDMDSEPAPQATSKSDKSKFDSTESQDSTGRPVSRGRDSSRISADDQGPVSRSRSARQIPVDPSASSAASASAVSGSTSRTAATAASTGTTTTTASVNAQPTVAAPATVPSADKGQTEDKAPMSASRANSSTRRTSLDGRTGKERPSSGSRRRSTDLTARQQPIRAVRPPGLVASMSTTPPGAKDKEPTLSVRRKINHPLPLKTSVVHGFKPAQGSGAGTDHISTDAPRASSSLSKSLRDGSAAANRPFSNPQLNSGSSTNSDPGNHPSSPTARMGTSPMSIPSMRERFHSQNGSQSGSPGSGRERFNSIANSTQFADLFKDMAKLPFGARAPTSSPEGSPRSQFAKYSTIGSPYVESPISRHSYGNDSSASDSPSATGFLPELGNSSTGGRTSNTGRSLHRRSSSRLSSGSDLRRPSSGNARKFHSVEGKDVQRALNFASDPHQPSSNRSSSGRDSPRFRSTSSRG
eukprot:TRINITY_DN214_c0_g1_i4.p1 TRINITY_DN214_c0_g1~~TRINITY_DN214_c0_g1_i4.p1  ORF type:complete len:760 (+),score=119.52 TRINITY_DN214_c0_g1_i4:623-2902(+)